jgi:hypothetical protein
MKGIARMQTSLSNEERLQRARIHESVFLFHNVICGYTLSADLSRL